MSMVVSPPSMGCNSSYLITPFRTTHEPPSRASLGFTARWTHLSVSARVQDLTTKGFTGLCKAEFKVLQGLQG